MQLSSEIGLAQGYISELEKGKKSVTDEVVNKVRERYGVEIVEQCIQEAPQFQQYVEGDGTTGTGDVHVDKSCKGESVPMEAFNKMMEEIAEQRKLVSKSQEQIDRLLNMLENK
ncbi:MAG: helix-turn-helix domain-containing protein [Muribaculum sp.]|nr:helix-turn-helix domain-containing protein [Muribaculaceae bacterium]MCM1081068.1 helix-turn-helix domain-containing protein [Muribaculum sp.]